ncbi:MAG: Shedu anti-phage system protein SduA domain-containing protein, partial [Candidatus Hodarchaeota archaeon]
VGWPAAGVTVNPEISDKLRDELEKLKGAKKRKTAQIRRLQQTVENLMNDLDFFREQHIRDKLPEFEKSLTEFKRLVRQEKKESVYQKFFEKNSWLLGLEYIKAKPQKKAGAKDIPDFLMERFDGFNDIIELKKPSDKLFIEDGGKLKQSKDLKNAISEVMDYIDYYSIQYPYEKAVLGNNVFKPKAIIIIGKSLTEDAKQKLRQHNSYLHEIEIRTYDDIAERAKMIIEFHKQ